MVKATPNTQYYMRVQMIYMMTTIKMTSLAIVYRFVKRRQKMSNLVVFNDSHKSDGFEQGVALINKELEKHELKVKLQFIEDYVSDEGEYAWHISVVPDDLPTTLG
tara:strand:- start:104 stop:421 length:318 start_codon:yes stop_codon:yes gene_type:complete